MVSLTNPLRNFKRTDLQWMIFGVAASTREIDLQNLTRVRDGVAIVRMDQFLKLATL